MIPQKPQLLLIITVVVGLVLITACAAGAAGDEAVRDGELILTFDGESCTWQYPTVLKAGPVTLLFFNESEGSAAVNLVRHTGDETIQDMIDYIGEEPSTKHYPSWTQELGTWKSVPPGESLTWEGVLEPGIYTMGCARLEPLGGWYGGGFTVED